MNVEVVKQPELRLAGIRHVGPYWQISETFKRLNEIVTAARLSNKDTKLVGIYYDDPSTTPEEELKSDAAITISSKIQLLPGLTEIVIPAGRYAHTTHVGPYSGLGEAWGFLRLKWVPRNGESVGHAMSYEVYRNTPMYAKPDELITDLYLPLE